MATGTSSTKRPLDLDDNDEEKSITTIPPQQQHQQQQQQAVKGAKNTNADATMDDDVAMEDAELRDYITKCLEKFPRLQGHSTVVTAILQAAYWQINGFTWSNQALLVDELKDPWNYITQNRKLSPKLSQISQDAISNVHLAAVAIAMALVQPATGANATSATERVQLAAAAAAAAVPSAAAVAAQPATAVAAQSYAKKFLDSIQKEPEPIPKSNGMKVWRDIVTNLDTGATDNIILRKITFLFWERCIQLVNATDVKYNVCAVGTPGTGKTTTTPVLIKMLLERECTVVYLKRTLARRSWYYEFAPGKKPVLYPESAPQNTIPSLDSPSTYYIVDPGNTKDSCGTDESFLPKTIIIASPDERHWGGSHFRKRQTHFDSIKVRGKFCYFPIWSLEELIASRKEIDISESDVVDLFREFGGVPRHVFFPTDKPDLLVDQQCAINKLSADQVLAIAMGQFDAVGTLGPDQPKGTLVGLHSMEDFLNFSVTIISAAVAEKVYSSYMNQLWHAMLNSDEHGWKIFEAYCRSLMVNEVQEFSSRRCVGKGWEEYTMTSPVKIGGCSLIRLALDIVAASHDTPETVFYSVDRLYELIDFIYRDGTGSFHAFQVTTGKTHKASATAISALKKAVADNKLSIYYLVPGERFEKFVTSPVSPKVKDCDIYHVLIPDPGKEGKVANPPK